MESWKPTLIAFALVFFGFSLGMFVDRLHVFYQNRQLTKATKGLQQKAPTLQNLVYFFGKHLDLSTKQQKTTKTLVRKFVRLGLKHFRDRPVEVDLFLRKGRAIRLQFRGEMRKVLTPRQRKRFDQMVQEIDRRRIVTLLRQIRFQRQELQKKK
jgi:hypothetical protein